MHIVWSDSRNLSSNWTKLFLRSTPRIIALCVFLCSLLLCFCFWFSLLFCFVFCVGVYVHVYGVCCEPHWCSDTNRILDTVLKLSRSLNSFPRPNLFVMLSLLLLVTFFLLLLWFTLLFYLTFECLICLYVVAISWSFDLVFGFGFGFLSSGIRA